MPGMTGAIVVAPHGDDQGHQTKERAMATPLEELAEAADAAAGHQRRIARRARALDRVRQDGTSWRTTLDGERRPGLVELVAAGARQVGEASTRFRGKVAQGLVAEGVSIREIARRFGVTHQRVSTLLRRASTNDRKGHGG